MNELRREVVRNIHRVKTSRGGKVRTYWLGRLNGIGVAARILGEQVTARQIHSMVNHLRDSAH